MHSSTTSRSVEQKVERVLAPFDDFVKDQSFGSVLLVVSTVAALLWSNFLTSYEAVFAMAATVGVGDWHITMSVREWISEGLMALFFYVLGMEIKRELLAGELSDPRVAVPVALAALGGMLVPAVFYLAFTWQEPDLIDGWGIPMATDAAFAIGLLTLLRKRIPASLITFITALAIMDDLGAILVIALFYSSALDIVYLLWTAGGVAVLFAGNLLGVRTAAFYLVGGVCTWYALHHSGIHATIAGILVAAAVPARSARGTQWLLTRVKGLLGRFEQGAQGEIDMLQEDDQHDIAEDMEKSLRKATTPLQRWENFIESPVYFYVMPLFALANAGVSMDTEVLERWLTSPLSVAIGVGLVGGKVLGIAGVTWVAVATGVGRLPAGASFRHMVGIGLLAAIGFTMSIFITGLSFPAAHAHYDVAMISILLTSLTAGLAGVIWLRFFCPAGA